MITCDKCELNFDPERGCMDIPAAYPTYVWDVEVACRYCEYDIECEVNRKRTWKDEMHHCYFCGNDYRDCNFDFLMDACVYCAWELNEQWEPEDLAKDEVLPFDRIIKRKDTKYVKKKQEKK